MTQFWSNCLTLKLGNQDPGWLSVRDTSQSQALSALSPTLLNMPFFTLGYTLWILSASPFSDKHLMGVILT